MNDQDWRGFSSAFDRAVRPDARPAHSGARVIAIGVAVVVAVGLAALLKGALGGGRAVASPDEVKPVSQPSSRAAGAPHSGTSWTAVAGPGCASDATSAFTAYGYYTGTNSDQTTGWSTSAKGGYSGGSCTGSYLSLPVSGQSASYDEDRFALWRFDFHATYTSASCTLATYVPKGTRTTVGGDPAYYYYFQTDDGYGSGDSPLGGYRVDQVGQHGRWVTGSPFKVRTGVVTVKLVDAGARGGGAAKDAHVAAAQVRLTCRAA